MKLQSLDEKQLESKAISIKNIVAKLDLDIELDLSYLSSQMSNTTYEPEEYPSLIFRPEGYSTVLVTNTGILLFTGGDSVKSIREVYLRTIDEFESFGLDKGGEIEDIEIVNIVSTIDVNNELDLNVLSVKLGFENVEYEPEQFPGLVYRIDNGPVVLLFASGKIVITGGASTQEILDASDRIREIISGENFEY